MTRGDRILKRLFDLVVSFIGLTALCWLICIVIVVASIDTRQWGIFTQKRVGQYGKLFKIFKVRSMRNVPGITTTITASGDPRISSFGAIIRRFKLDELPQLWNVFIGKMSFVGPRPDVPGYLDMVEGDDRVVLELKPGITGPASLRFRNEEELLAAQSDPKKYNDEVIWPEKVKINKQYIEEYSFWKDIGFIIQTIFGS